MTPFDFIFMLTRNDRTVADAAVHAETALRAGIRHIGFKDVGLPFDALAGLARQIREGGASTYLEVVSLDRDSEIRSVKAAIDLGVDYLLGGTHVEDVLPLLEGTPTRYYPFPGRIVGHPSILEGTQAEIVKSAVALASHPGVAGLDLLAYRSGGNVPSLIDAVCRAVPKPVIVAGSVDRPDQIEAIRKSGAAGFTVGTSALEQEQRQDRPGPLLPSENDDPAIGSFEDAAHPCVRRTRLPRHSVASVIRAPHNRQLSNRLRRDGSMTGPTRSGISRMIDHSGSTRKSRRRIASVTRSRAKSSPPPPVDRCTSTSGYRS